MNGPFSRSACVPGGCERARTQSACVTDGCARPRAQSACVALSPCGTSRPPISTPPVPPAPVTPQLGILPGFLRPSAPEPGEGEKLIELLPIGIPEKPGDGGLLASFESAEGVAGTDANRVVPPNAAFHWTPSERATRYASSSTEDASTVLLTTPGTYAVTFRAPVTRGGLLGIELDGAVLERELAGTPSCGLLPPLARKLRPMEFMYHITAPSTASRETPSRLRIVNVSSYPIRSGRRNISGAEFSPKLSVVLLRAEQPAPVRNHSNSQKKN